jgi:hypothetical protein
MILSAHRPPRAVAKMRVILSLGSRRPRKQWSPDEKEQRSCWLSEPMCIRLVGGRKLVKSMSNQSYRPCG